MTTLDMCELGSICHVKKLHSSGALKERLMALGIMKGADIVLLTYSVAKKTFEIKIGRTTLALRKEEAALIEVHDGEG